jgi:hypothetical protein
MGQDRTQIKQNDRLVFLLSVLIRVHPWPTMFWPAMPPAASSVVSIHSAAVRRILETWSHLPSQALSKS